MALFIFAALVITMVSAVVWGTAAVALRQSRQEPPPLEEVAPETGWSITETGAAPGWSITPAHLRMW
jgi:hypothetical protein